ncbi:MAG: Methyltransferase type 12 [Humibacillus sp.]|nr:Methyltransferase type 12 [Humibacillus sp.]
MDAQSWNERYAAADLVWSTGPNAFVEELLTPVVAAHPEGSALDVAAGEGRNAIWLAQQGWSVTATDYASVAVERMRRRAAEVLGEDAARLTAVVADATRPPPGATQGYDVALLSYLQLPAPEMGLALRAALAAVRPGGHLLLVGHAARNLEEGWGGPSDPAVLHDPEDVLGLLRDGVQPGSDRGEDAAAFEVVESGIRVRRAETADGPREALDTVVLLTRA